MNDEKQQVLLPCPICKGGIMMFNGSERMRIFHHMCDPGPHPMYPKKIFGGSDAHLADIWNDYVLEIKEKQRAFKTNSKTGNERYGSPSEESWYRGFGRENPDERRPEADQATMA